VADLTAGNADADRAGQHAGGSTGQPEHHGRAQVTAGVERA